jgi:putative two-component system response regulator
MAERIALSHHERWDGSGYPNGLRGEEIALEGRICAVADVFDALRSKRPYKEAWTDAEAIEELQRNRGTMFDPLVIDAFVRVLPQLDLSASAPAATPAADHAAGPLEPVAA